MYLLLSGEGSGDMGACDSGLGVCTGEQFKPGPMSVIVDQLVELSQDFEFSYLENQLVSFVSKSFLAESKQKPLKKKMSFRGKKKPAETKYYFENARLLAVVAKQKSVEVNDTVLAVLFRDSDGTASAGRGDWKNKRDSMVKGFEVEAYEFGVPMVPNPKSEAWLLCAVKGTSYQACHKLENESGNDRGMVPLKDQLSEALCGKSSVIDIKEMLIDKRIDVEKIDMPSFNQFKVVLGEKVRLALRLP